VGKPVSDLSDIEKWFRDPTRLRKLVNSQTEEAKELRDRMRRDMIALLKQNDGEPLRQLIRDLRKDKKVKAALDLFLDDPELKPLVPH
jgi:hypothetical protein